MGIIIRRYLNRVREALQDLEPGGMLIPAADQRDNVLVKHLHIHHMLLACCNVALEILAPAPHSGAAGRHYSFPLRVRLATHQL